MRTFEKELENKIIDTSKLLDYGFSFNEDFYLFKRKLSISPFEMEVRYQDDKLTSLVKDIELNEEYILVDLINEGNYLLKIKQEYEYFLKDILDKCSVLDAYKNEQTKKVIEYIESKYKSQQEFPWKDELSYSVFRNSKSKKWFALFMIIPRNKLEGKDKSLIEVINLKHDRDDIPNIVNSKTIFNAYHMNKKTWITIPLDMRLDLEEIYKLVDQSYLLNE